MKDDAAVLAKTKDHSKSSSEAAPTPMGAPETKRPHILLAASPKGGVGKSTLSRNIAVAATASGLKVALADFDAQQSTVRWWERRPENMSEIAIFAAEMTPTDVDDVLCQAREQEFDLLIVDTPTALEAYPEAFKALILASDMVLVPTGVSIDDTESVRDVMAQVVGLRKPGAYVLSKVDSRSRRSLNTARMRLNASGKLCPIEIPLYDDFVSAAELGVSVIEIKKAKGADEVVAVWTFARNEIGL
jgi:chromosome partitioning protein